SGGADGSGSSARFDIVDGLAVDAHGNLLVADRGNHTIRKITPAGVVTTLANVAGFTGSADGRANAARFNNPSGLAMDANGNLFVADRGNQTVRKGAPVFQPPAVEISPQSQQVNAGANVTLSVAAIGGELSYQWKQDG